MTFTQKRRGRLWEKAEYREGYTLTLPLTNILPLLLNGRADVSILKEKGMNSGTGPAGAGCSAYAVPGCRIKQRDFGLVIPGH